MHHYIYFMCFEILYRRFPVKHTDYGSLLPPVGHTAQGPKTRKQQQESEGTCSCSLCYVGRLSGGQYNYYLARVSDPAGRPTSTDTQSVPCPQVVCSECLSSYGPGRKHDCCEKTRRNNLEDLLPLSSTPSKEKIL